MVCGKGRGLERQKPLCNATHIHQCYSLPMDLEFELFMPVHVFFNTQHQITKVQSPKKQKTSSISREWVKDYT